MAKFNIQDGVLVRCYTEPSDNGCITIPLHVFEIGRQAFISGATPITRVLLPNNLLVIREEAFLGHRYLEEIHIPPGVRHIGAKAFYHTDVKAYIYGSWDEWDDNWDVCDEIPAKFLKKSETIYLSREDKKASYATFQQALAEKNKERSTRLLQSLADFGYAPAYAFLAWAYLHGSGCTASLASAKKYIHLAETAFAPGFDTHYIYADIKLKSENAEEIQEAINLYKNFSSQLDAVIVLVETVSADKKLRDFAKSLLAHGYSQIGDGYRLLGNEEEAKFWNARAALTNPRLLEDPAMQAVLTHLKTYHDYKNSLGV